MKIQAAISKGKIRRQVGIETAWTGKADGDIERGYIGESENPLFENKFAAALNDVNDVIIRYGRITPADDADQQPLTLDMPANFPETEAPRILPAIEKFITLSVVAEWAAVLKDERTKYYQEKTLDAAAEVARILNRRKKNRRNIYRQPRH